MLMYKNLILLIIILTITSCHNENKFNWVDNTGEFDKIIETVINNDSLKVTRENKENYVVIEYLEKKKIIVPKKNDRDSIVFVSHPDELPIENLFYLWQVQSKGFDKKDSLYLLSQNSNPDSLRITENLLSKIKHLTYKQTEQELEKGNYLKFYTFTIPIISRDGLKAYLESGYRCGGMCGNGRAYFLEKKHGKWIVTKIWGTWIS